MARNMRQRIPDWSQNFFYDSPSVEKPHTHKLTEEYNVLSHTRTQFNDNVILFW